MPCALSALVAAAGSAGVPFGSKPPGTLLLPGVFVAVGVLPTLGFKEVIGAPELLTPKGAPGLETVPCTLLPRLSSITNCAVSAASALSRVCAGFAWQNWFVNATTAGRSSPFRISAGGKFFSCLSESMYLARPSK